MFDKEDIVGKKYEGYTILKCLGKEKGSYRYSVLFDNGQIVERTRSSILKGLSIPKIKKPIKRTKATVKDITTINGYLDDSSVLVLDQATSNTGYAIIKNNYIITYGKLENKHHEIYHRMVAMIDDIETIVSKYDIKSVVLENIYLGQNVHTFKTLSGLIGAISYWCIKNNISLTLISNSCWTSYHCISGKRDQRKKQSIDIARKVTGNARISDDESDAICIAQYVGSRNSF